MNGKKRRYLKQKREERKAKETEEAREEEREQRYKEGEIETEREEKSRAVQIPRIQYRTPHRRAEPRGSRIRGIHSQRIRRRVSRNRI